MERQDGNRRVTFLAPPSIGLPYGRVPRLILIHLATEAVRNKSREVDLGQSLTGFMKSLFTMPTGGQHGSIQSFKAQLPRLLSLTTTVNLFDEERALVTNAPMADEFDIHWVVLQTGRSGLPARVRLGERMYNQMVTSAVPIDLRAVRALQQNVLALDIYFWTTFRAHRVARTHPARITWTALQTQFGAGYAAEGDFRIAFCQALEQVRLVYPKLLCSPTKAHFELFWSPPSVPKLQGDTRG